MTINDNITIQKFMGKPLTTRGFFPADNILHYHDDYRCIMLVVEKIESTYHPQFGTTKFKVLIEANYCMISIDVVGNNKMIADCKANTKIEAIYLAVIQFINWYNERKK